MNIESNKGLSKQSEEIEILKNSIFVNDELANLKKITDIDNCIEKAFDDLVVCSANDSHVSEIAELWANLACVQQIFAPERYNFVTEGKDWQSFVRKKLSKKNNLLLVAYKNGHSEIKGFLYLQTVTLPSSDLILKGIIEDIYTKPQHRKQGIAFRLLDVALDWASNQNIKQVSLISLTRTSDLSSFYSKVLKKIKKNLNLELLTF